MFFIWRHLYFIFSFQNFYCIVLYSIVCIVYIVCSESIVHSNPVQQQQTRQTSPVSSYPPNTQSSQYLPVSTQEEACVGKMREISYSYYHFIPRTYYNILTTQLIYWEGVIEGALRDNLTPYWQKEEKTCMFQQKGEIAIRLQEADQMYSDLYQRGWTKMLERNGTK